MKILVVGSGAREHALCWKLAQSPRTSELLCTPGNPGTDEVARNLPFKGNDIAGIAAAVQKKILRHGVMHACVRHDVDIVLTGAIRDEGPIPGVTTDVIEAQKVMRQKLADVTHVMLLATVQHSLAVASMLAPSTKTVCVDIDPSAVERAVEHQPLQSIGLITDVEPFLRELADYISESSVRG